MFSLSSYFSVQYLVLLLPRHGGALCGFAPKAPPGGPAAGQLPLFLGDQREADRLFALFHPVGSPHRPLAGGYPSRTGRCLAAAPKEERKAVRGRFQRQLTGIVAFGVVLHLGLLLLVKYTPFFATNLNHLFQLLGLSLTVNIPSFAMPIGISFTPPGGVLLF